MRAWTFVVLLMCAACAGRKAAPPAPAPTPEPPPAVKEADPAELKRLYDAAVDAYAMDRREEAGRLFRRMLELDPGNASAIKGLRRLSLEP